MKKLFINPLLILSFLLCYQWNVQARSLFSEADIISDTKDLLTILSEYDYGDSRAWLNDFQDLMRRIHDTPEIYPQVEELMISFLKSDATFYGKQFVCTQIGIIGTKKSIPILSKMLINESTSEMALLGLEPINDPYVDKTLRKSLTKTKGKYKVGIINSLGVRKDSNSVKTLSKLIFDEDKLVSISSVAALGKIGTDNASQVLGTAYQQAVVPLKWDIADAWLLTAEYTNSKEQSFSIYQEVYKSSPPVSIKTAALKGLLKTHAGDPSEYLLPALKDREPSMQEAVIPLIRELDEKYSVEVYMDELPNLEENLQMQLVLGIADRGDLSAHGHILNLIKSNNQALRLAGLRTFPDYAKSSDIVFLARFASKNKGRERDLARICLYTMNSENVDDAILTVAQKACPEERVELIRAMGYRDIISGCDLLLITVKHPERKVRLESYKTLAKLGTPEYLPAIIDLMIKAESNAERKEAEKTITSIAETIPDASIRSDKILRILSGTNDVNAIVSCINILGNLGTEKSLAALRNYLNNEEAKIQVAAIKALSAWPDASPKEDLLGVLLETEDIKQHNLAMQGYIKLTNMDEAVSEDKKVKLFEEALNLANDVNEQKIVLSGLAKVNSMDALNLAIKLLNDTKIRNEAEAAVIDISGDVGQLDPEKTQIILNQLIKETENPDFRSRIEETLQWIK